VALLLFPPQEQRLAQTMTAIHSRQRNGRFASQWKLLNMRRAYWYHSFDSHSIFCYSLGVAGSWKSP
jgi:hypothetical protein